MSEILIPCAGSSGNYGDIIVGCPFGSPETNTFFQMIKDKVGEFVTFGIPIKEAGFLSGLIKYWWVFLILFLTILWIIYYNRKK